MEEEPLVEYHANGIKSLHTAIVKPYSMVAVKTCYDSIMDLYNTFVDHLVFTRKQCGGKKGKICFQKLLSLLVID